MTSRRACECDKPQVFGNDVSCHKCGCLAGPQGVHASTWRLAIAIAEVMLGYRKLNDPVNRKKPPPP